MIKVWAIAPVAVILAGCAGDVPDSRPGVGFGDYDAYQAETAGSFVPPAVVNSVPLSATGTGTVGTGELAAAGIGARTPGLDATPTNAAPLVIDNSGISDEQNFDAVASRETIESDADRRAQQAAQYQIVAPGAEPVRSGDTGPNIVEYALSAPNVKGQEWYSRFIFFSKARFERNCASFESADEAQRAFLASGGPERDPRGIDPDGDGFACEWDPAPYRLARTQQQGG